MLTVDPDQTTSEPPVVGQVGVMLGSMPVFNGSGRDHGNNTLDTERFRALVEQIPAIVYTLSLDGTDTYSYMSPQVFAILGFPATEVVNRPGFFASRIHPDDRPQVEAANAQAMATWEPFRCEYRVMAEDGDWVCLRDEAILIRDVAGAPLHWQGVLLDVSEQRAAQAALRESEERLRTVLNAAPVGIVVVDESGEIVLSNPIAERLAGMTKEELHGRNAADPRWPAIHEDGSPFVGGESPPLVSLRTGEPCTGVVMGIGGASGETIWLSVNSQPLYRDAEPVPVGAVATIVDLTHRRALEHALRKGEERFRALVQNSYDVITVVGADGIRKYVSPSIERLLGYAPDELEGGSALDLVHPDDIPAMREVFASCLAGEPRTPVVSFRFRRRDGEWRDFEAVGTNLLDHPTIAGIVFNSRDVTARRSAEVALQSSEARFRSMFEGAGVGSALADREGRIMVANPALGALLGYSPGELVGMRIDDLSHPDERGRQDELRRQLWAGERSGYQLEKRYVRSDGEAVWGLLHTTGIRDASGMTIAALGQIQDITARKTAETALRESEERFRTAFDHAPIGFALVSPDGRFRQVNRALCNIVGYTEAELLGRSFSDITHPDDLDDNLALAGRLWAGQIGGYQIEKRYLHKDGRTVWVQLTASGVRAHGDRAGYGIAQVQDISGRRHLEMERAIMLASEREYTRQLRGLTEMRSELTSIVSHELNAPISAMRMMTAMLATREVSPSEEAQALAVIQDQISQLERLAADFARAADAERDDFSVQFHPVSLMVLLGSAAAAAETFLMDHPFVMESAPDVRVWCDPERIQQVFSNLLGNVAKHTPPGTAVVLRSFLAGDRVIIEIEDDGPGIAAEDLAIVFEKFGRGRESTMRKTAGTGLGLYVSRGIVSAHGDELSVESGQGTGTRFRFSLKVAS